MITTLRLLVVLALMTPGTGLFAEDSAAVDPALLAQLPPEWAEVLVEVVDDEDAAVLWAAWDYHPWSDADRAILDLLSERPLFAWSRDELQQIAPWLEQQQWVFDLLRAGLQRPSVHFFTWNSHQASERATHSMVSDMLRCVAAKAHWASANNDHEQLKSAVELVLDMQVQLRQSAPSTGLDMVIKASLSQRTISLLMDLEQRQPLHAELRRMILQRWAGPSVWQVSPWSPLRGIVLGDLLQDDGNDQLSESVNQSIIDLITTTEGALRRSDASQETILMTVLTDLQYLHHRLEASPVVNEQLFSNQLLVLLGDFIDQLVAITPLSDLPIDTIGSMPAEWIDSLAIAQFMQNSSMYLSLLTWSAALHDLPQIDPPKPESWNRDHVEGWLGQPLPRARLLVAQNMNVYATSGLKRPHRALLLENLAKLRMVALLHPSDGPLDREHLKRALAAEGLPGDLLNEPWNGRALQIRDNVIFAEGAIIHPVSERWLWSSQPEPWIRLDMHTDSK